MWIKNYCKLTFSPCISDVSKYENAWWQWWTSCQPPWRPKDLRTDPPHHTVPPEADWSVVKKGGLNGLLGVMIALGFWREHIQVGHEEYSHWLSAMWDVAWVMNIEFQESKFQESDLENFGTWSHMTSDGMENSKAEFQWNMLDVDLENFGRWNHMISEMASDIPVHSRPVTWLIAPYIQWKSPTYAIPAYPDMIYS
ncbi:hypothetical protein BS47DRAFT_1356997 [Hydnum rufescens UP504]|uniref:Uncharacterized protein n=1 Tax=Hydnum rufescens UP504 TaxID=1448309 RepID=A0A9P6BBH1_9AGAM|nr:hypothetical protein BS47DRAFT_1356997 [Hydnum rufescens UP504]